MSDDILVMWPMPLKFKKLFKIYFILSLRVLSIYL